MAKMTAAEAAIRVLESEGVDLAFGQPGAAILPLYQAMRARGTIRHVLVRHEEGGTHAAEGYSRASGHQIEKALEMLMAAERPLIIAGGGVINADASELLVDFAEVTNTPVVPTLMGWGSIPDDHRLNAGMVGIQTQHRYGNANFLRSDFVLGIGNRWANRHTGTSLGIYTNGRKCVHVDVDPMQIGKVFCPDLGIVADAHSALEQFVDSKN